MSTAMEEAPERRPPLGQACQYAAGSNDHVIKLLKFNARMHNGTGDCCDCHSSMVWMDSGCASPDIAVATQSVPTSLGLALSAFCMI